MPVTDKPELYFERDSEFREWLHDHHDKSDGVYLIFYKVGSEFPSMRWEEAVQVALSYGWIDSTVKNLGGEKRRQYFCPRKPNSGWSKINKMYIEELTENGLMEPAGLAAVEVAISNGSWSVYDDAENGVIPDDLQTAFDEAPDALKNFEAFTQSQRKGYLYWLCQAKRQTTRDKRIKEIVRCSGENLKYRR